MSSDLEQFDFSPYFLLHVLQACITDTNFASKVINILEPNIFRTKEKKFLFTLIRDYYREYKEAPKDHFFEVFEEEKKSLSEKSQKIALDVIETIAEINHSNPQYLLNKLHEAISYIEFEDALVEAAQLHKKRKLGEAKNVILKAIRKPENIRATYYNFLKDQSYVEKRVTGKTYKMRTMIKEFDALIGGFNPGWLITVLGSGKSGKCLEENEKILLSDGQWIPIKDIVKNKITNIVSLNEDGNLIKKEISDFYNNGKKDCYRVITRTGREVITTLNHPFLTINGWTALEKLNIGSNIAVPNKINFFGKKTIPFYKVRTLAYLLADGGLSRPSTIGFTKKNSFIMDDFIKCIEQNFQDTISVVDNKTVNITNNYKISKTKKWLQSINCKFDLSKNKLIPEIVFSLTKHCLQEFLSTLFTCDGSIYTCKDGRSTIDYSTSSKEMAHQVQHLLLRFGIISKLRKKHTKLNNKIFPSFLIEISNKENIIKFIKEIGFKFSKKIKSNKVLSNLDKTQNNREFLSIFPYEYVINVKYQLDNYIKENGKKNRKWHKQKPLQLLRGALNRKTGLRKNTIEQIAKIINSEELTKNINNNVLWDTIISIEYVGKRQTYDLTVPTTENFVASDVIVHNTKTLLEFCVAGVIQGLNGLFISLEMGKNEIDNALDQAVGFLGDKPGEEVDIMEYNKFKKEWRQERKIINTIFDLDLVSKNRKALSRFGGNLIISDQTDGRKFNFYDQEALIDQIEQEEGIVLDFVATDYLGEMGRTEKNQKKKERIADNASGLKAGARSRNIIQFTAMQKNRAGDIADAIEPVWVSDLIINIKQSKKEEMLNQCTYYVEEYRHGPKHMGVSLIRDLRRGQVSLGKGKNIHEEEINEGDSEY